MPISLFQKLKLGMHGWSRRRDDEAAKRNAEFIEKSTAWARRSPESKVPGPESRVRSNIDFDGLQVAYLDDSGRIAHYFDVETGEVHDIRASDAMGEQIRVSPDRYRRIPQRSPESEALDRLKFAASLEKGPIRDSLERAVQDPDEYRRVLAQDRGIERAWYSFKNDRAAEAIDRWLKEQTKN